MHLAIVDDLETDLQSLKNLLCTYLEPRHIIHEISLFYQRRTVSFRLLARTV